MAGSSSATSLPKSCAGTSPRHGATWQRPARCWPCWVVRDLTWKAILSAVVDHARQLVQG